MIDQTMVHYSIRFPIFIWLFASVLLASCATPVRPTATPTPSAAQQAQLARLTQAAALGQYDQVGTLALAVIEADPDSEAAALARYYLAESFDRRGRAASALAAWDAFLAQPPADQPDLVVWARFQQAAALARTGDPAQAITRYGELQALATPLAPYAAVAQAELLAQQGRTAEALAAHLQAARSTIARSERAASYEQAIGLALQQGDTAQAVDLYRELLDLASFPAYRARLLHAAATLALQQGDAAQAQAWWQELVQASPQAAEAPLAVRALLPTGAITAALAADVLAGAQAYTEAIPQYDAAIARSTDPPDAFELARRRALAVRATGDLAGAQVALSDILSGTRSLSPTIPAYLQAELDLVQTTGQLGDVAAAIDGYGRLAASNPAAPLAPVALDRMAQLRLREGNVLTAAQVWLDLAQAYPASEQAAPALAQAAPLLLQLGQPDAARQAWEVLLGMGSPAQQAEAAYRIARLLEQGGDPLQARPYYEQAYRIRPDSFTGWLAMQAGGIAAGGTVALDAPISAAEWADAAAWLAARTSPLTATASMTDALASLAGSQPVRRAVDLAAIGEPIRARSEWTEARLSNATSAVHLLALGRLASEARNDRAALDIADALADLLPPDTPLPLALDRLRYPAPYAVVLQAEARANGIDPRLLLALLRQESRFDPVATSVAGARGLAQIMPATGGDIAASLGVAGFTPDDLYSPARSLQFGAYYLGQRVSDMGGSMAGGLAAYNAGLGNALRWSGGAPVNDTEAFVSTIDFPETYNYVQVVLGNYAAYQRIYAAEPTR